MFDPIIILFVLTIALMEGVHALPAGPDLPALWLSAFVIAILLAIVGIGYAANAVFLRRFDRTGSSRAMINAFRLEPIAKLMIGGHWLASTLCLDWVGTVRIAVGGDLILIDEALATLPFLTALFLIYGLPHAMQERAREAAMIRAIEQGLTVRPGVGFMAYIAEAVRHRAAILLVPVILLTVLSESIERLTAWFKTSHASLAATAWGEWLPSIVQTLAAIVVLCLLPLLLRVLWSTSRLPACPTRDRLLAMCEQQGVKIRDILVWHTHRGMLNGALIGVLPRFRYILLTDALIDRLPASQLEAVMAHEIAHARRHHLPWLLGAMIAVVTIASVGIWLIARPFLLGIENLEQRAFWGDVLSGSSLAAAMLIAFLCFGYISRRFERQADAFATQHLSGLRFKRGQHPPTDRCPVISGHAVLAMQRALGSVAAAGGMPTERFTFRHGSIAGRHRALQRLICKPALALPVDRSVRKIKRVTAVLFVIAIGLSVYQVHIERVDAESARRQMLREWQEQVSPLRWLQTRPQERQ